MLRLGFMAGLRDFSQLKIPGSDFSEIILFDGDLDRVDSILAKDLRLKAASPIEFVHAQEFVTHNGCEILVDLASADDSLRKMSIDVVNRTRALSKMLGEVSVVIHPGGIGSEKGACDELLANLRKSLEELGPAGLLLENMPWFYWLRKSKRVAATICVTIEDMRKFEDQVEGFALDTSHGYLSVPSGDQSYCPRFLNELAGKARHLHVSDARAPDSEGLQIGSGDIDFSMLKGCDLPMVVEIWKGHEASGAGFKLGIERLRAIERSW